MKNINELKEQIAQGKKFKYLFFLSHIQKSQHIDKSCLSQWYPAGFSVDGVYYATAEHYMMAEKARLFDASKVEKIINSKSAGEAKALGREVDNFNQELWDRVSFDIVVKGNLAKFSQNEELKAFLLASKNRVLAEASPKDRIWGIGLSVDNKDAQNPYKWRGLNKLGFALMVVREKLSEELECKYIKTK